MQIKQNDIVVDVPDNLVIEMAMQRLHGNANSVTEIKPEVSLPAIGTYWPGQGGIFAGLMRGRDGGRDYALILGPTMGEGTFEKMNDKAAKVEQDKFNDFRLPYRNEQSLLYANLKDQFKPEWYWSCERPPDYEGYAYAQYFDDGYQDLWLVNHNYLGVAVRVAQI